MKRFFALLLCLAFVFTIFSPMAIAAEDKPINVMLSGKPLTFDQPPIMVNNRVLVPLRAIFEGMNADVEWDDDFRMITATRGLVSVKLQIDYDKICISNGGKLSFEPLDVPPCIISDRTLVPLRAVAQAFGAEVNWLPDSRTVTIRELDRPAKHDFGGYGNMENYIKNSGATVSLDEAQVTFALSNPYIQPLLPCEMAHSIINDPKHEYTCVNTPKTTGNAIVDLALDEILARILTPDMTQNEMLRAVYDYLIFNYTHDADYSYNDRFAKMPNFMEGEEYYIRNVTADSLMFLYTGSGIYDHFASTFTSFMWRLGFESEKIEGYFINSVGTRSPHAWSRVSIGGEWFYFDPAIESMTSKPTYNAFLQTESEFMKNHAWGE